MNLFEHWPCKTLLCTNHAYNNTRVCVDSSTIPTGRFAWPFGNTLRDSAITELSCLSAAHNGSSPNSCGCPGSESAVSTPTVEVHRGKKDGREQNGGGLAFVLDRRERNVDC